MQIVHGGTLMKTWREEIDPWKTSSGVIANFSEVGSTNRLWWPDLTWPGIFFFSKSAQWMFRKSHQVWAFYLAAFGNGTSKTWGAPFSPPPPPGIGLNTSKRPGIDLRRKFGNSRSSEVSDLLWPLVALTHGRVIYSQFEGADFKSGISWPEAQDSCKVW